MSNNQLTLKNKLAYAFGGLGFQCSFTMVNSYLSVFYTDVVGILPAVLSGILMLIKIIDAVSVFSFGGIAQRTRSRWGHYRPYILILAPFSCVFTCLLFFHIDLPNIGQIVWLAVTYIVAAATNGCLGVALSCMPNSMTADNKERVNLNALYAFFGGVVMIGINAMTMPLIQYFGNGDTSNPKGYFIVSLLLAVVALPCLLFSFACTKEVVGVQETASQDTKKENIIVGIVKSFAVSMKDRNARCLLLALFFFLTGLFGRIGVMAYYFIYVLKNPNGIAFFASAFSAGMMLVNLYAPFLLNRFNKKFVGAAGCFVQAAFFVIFYVQGILGAGNLAVIITGFGFGLTNVVSLSCFTLGAEIIDDIWIRTGVRHDGTIVSALSFSSKLGNAVGSALFMFALGLVGYVANTELAPQVVSGINAVVNLIPAVFAVIGGILFLMIRMTNAKAKENEQYLRDHQLVQ